MPPSKRVVCSATMGWSLPTTAPRGVPGRTLLNGASAWVMGTESRDIAATLYVIVWLMPSVR